MIEIIHRLKSNPYKDNIYFVCMFFDGYLHKKATIFDMWPIGTYAEDKHILKNVKFLLVISEILKKVDNQIRKTITERLGNIIKDE